MIPTIEEILSGLQAGAYTRHQCAAWLETHMALAADKADAEHLRDHFAGLAMQGLVNSEVDGVYDGTSQDQLTAARAAYLIADAMLEVRAA